MNKKILDHVKNQIENYENLMKAHFADVERSQKKLQEAKENLSIWEEALKKLDE